MSLWRINLKPEAKTDIDVTEFCVQCEIVGVGWGVKRVPSSKQDYRELGHEWYSDKRKKSWRSATNAILDKVSVGELIWTRNRQGTYYLGEITGEWEYRNSEEHVNADIFNVRSCDWVRVGNLDNVPGAVINSFRARRTIQRVSEPGALLYSQYLFSKLKDKHYTPAADAAKPELLELLSDEDLEDVVAVFLQLEKRFIMFPSTCKSDTQAVECLFVSQEDGARVGLQVKSGQTPINQDHYSQFNGIVYLFAASGKYEGQDKKKRICLSRDEIETFVLAKRDLMPGRIQRWIEFIEDVK